jgi:hypothetical protein
MSKEEQDQKKLRMVERRENGDEGGGAGANEIKVRGGGK